MKERNTSSQDPPGSAPFEVLAPSDAERPDLAASRLLALRLVRDTVAGFDIAIDSDRLAEACDGLLAVSAELLGMWWSSVWQAGDPVVGALKWLDFRIQQAQAESGG